MRWRRGGSNDGRHEGRRPSVGRWRGWRRDRRWRGGRRDRCSGSGWWRSDRWCCGGERWRGGEVPCEKGWETPGSNKGKDRATRLRWWWWCDWGGGGGWWWWSRCRCRWSWRRCWRSRRWRDSWGSCGNGWATNSAAKGKDWAARWRRWRRCDWRRWGWWRGRGRWKRRWWRWRCW